MSHTVSAVWIVALCAVLLPCRSAQAADADRLSELDRMPVDQLPDVAVTLVSRREQRLRNAAAQWDLQDYLLADVERIGVLRGPGAAPEWLCE